jgi:hypothetical protein
MQVAKAFGDSKLFTENNSADLAIEAKALYFLAAGRSFHP